MRILLLSDIHANWAALSAIREEYDACLVLGDIVEYGPEPALCIDWVKQHATLAIRGNHDHSSAQRVSTPEGSIFRQLAAATRAAGLKHLTPTQIKFLSRLPVTQYTVLGGMSFYLVHATPRDPMDEYLTEDLESWKMRLAGIDADFVCVGHTHLPMLLRVGETQVINPGSVGQPRDGDPRAAYAIIENGKVEFRRVAYDVEATIAGLRALDLEEPVFELASQILRAGGSMRPATSATNVSAG